MTFLAAAMMRRKRTLIGAGAGHDKDGQAHYAKSYLMPYIIRQRLSSSYFTFFIS